MKLYLARHGHATTKEESADRPLSDAGRKDVSRVADILGQMGVSVDRVIHSGKPRAQQTAEILARSVLPGSALDISPDLNPHDPVEPWVERLSMPGEDIMLVGHLPFMGKLASRLVTGSEEPIVVRFDAGSVVCLEGSDDGKWTVVATANPSQ